MLRSKTRQAMPRPSREDACAALLSTTLRPVSKAVMARMDGERAAVVPASAVKTPGRVKQSIRDSANGEECTIRIPSVCNGRTDTTVLCHLPGIDGGRGMAMKAIDLAAAFGCVACHDVVDMRSKAPAGMTRKDVMLCFYEGHMRTLVRLMQKGLV